MKVAILHDWFFELGLRERVLESLCEIFLEADIFTFGTNHEQLPANIASRKITSAKLNSGKAPLWKFIDKFPKELAKFDLSSYDLIISNTQGPMRWIEKKPGQKHMSFFYQAYPFLHIDWQKVSKKKNLGSLFSRFNQESQLRFRQTDLEYSKQTDIALTNSQRMANVIRETYNISAAIVPLPVNHKVFYPRNHAIEDYYLLCDTIEIGRGIENIIEAFNYLKDHLIILGQGTSIETLAKNTRPNIKFITKDSENNRAKLMARARGVIISSTRHYNHSAAEALAMGRPLICHQASTAAELVRPGINGLTYTENEADSILPAMFDMDVKKLYFKNLTPVTTQGKVQFKEKIQSLLAEIGL